jgi:hypothetical protein
MSEREEEALSVVASTWSDDINVEKTNDYETVNEMEDMVTNHCLLGMRRTVMPWIQSNLSPFGPTCP